VIDGVFSLDEDGQLGFAEASALTPEDLVAVQQQVRARVLRWFARAGHLEQADARDMAGWHHGGGLYFRPLRLTPMRPALASTETPFRSMPRCVPKQYCVPANVSPF